MHNRLCAEETSLTARRTQPQETQPDLPAERAYPALTQQLRALKDFQGREYRQAKAGLDQWYVLTEKLILRSFGSESTNLRHFRNCRSAGLRQLGTYEMGYPRLQVPKPFMSNSDNLTFVD